MPPAPATDRLGRLLVMVPWLTARRRVPLGDLAAAFGITRKQAADDVLLVGMLGVPPYTGGCLVEVALDGDDVIAHPQPFLSRPPQLTPVQEATGGSRGAGRRRRRMGRMSEGDRAAAFELYEQLGDAVRGSVTRVARCPSSAAPVQRDRTPSG